MADLNYLGMPKLVEPVYEDTAGHLLIDPEKTSAEALTILTSKWEDVPAHLKVKKTAPRKRAPKVRG